MEGKVVLLADGTHLRFADGGACNDTTCNLWGSEHEQPHDCEGTHCNDGRSGKHYATVHVFVDKSVYYFLCGAQAEALAEGDGSVLFA